MKKKGYFIFLVLVSLILISGQACERKDKGGGGFLGGKDGLVDGFV